VFKGLACCSRRTIHDGDGITRRCPTRAHGGVVQLHKCCTLQMTHSSVICVLCHVGGWMCAVGSVHVGEQITFTCVVEKTGEEKTIVVCQDQTFQIFVDLIFNEFGQTYWPTLPNPSGGVMLVDSDDMFDMVCVGRAPSLSLNPASLRPLLPPPPPLLHPLFPPSPPPPPAVAASTYRGCGLLMLCVLMGHIF